VNSPEERAGAKRETFTESELRMPLLVNCPGCGRKLRIPDEFAGRKVKCPTCGEAFDANPSPEGAPPPAAAPAPAPLGTPVSVTPKAPPQPERPPREKDLRDDDDREGDGDRPWERGGELRRDCEPHRGNLVMLLGIFGTVCGGIALTAFCCSGLPGILALIGLPLSIMAWTMGGRDLAKMNEGVMDPQGRGSTQGGMICGIVGTVLNSLGLLMAVAIILYFVYIMTVVTQQMKTAPGLRPMPVSTAPFNPPPPPPVAPPVPPPGDQ
jgi:uncharacterized membrane protein YccF (DUF307 family)